jgi:hypothetical protein
VCVCVCVSLSVCARVYSVQMIFDQGDASKAKVYAESWQQNKTFKGLIDFEDPHVQVRMSPTFRTLAPLSLAPILSLPYYTATDIGLELTSHPMHRLVELLPERQGCSRRCGHRASHQAWATSGRRQHGRVSRARRGANIGSSSGSSDGWRGALAQRG